MFRVSVRGSAHQAGTSENLGFSQEGFPENGTEAFGHVLLLLRAHLKYMWT